MFHIKLFPYFLVLHYTFNSFNVVFSQTCDERFCLFPQQPNASLNGIEDAQQLCKNANEGSFPLEIYDHRIAELLYDSLSKNEAFYRHNILINLVEKTSEQWFYIDDITRELHPSSINLQEIYKNYMALGKTLDGSFEFRPSFGFEPRQAVCSKPTSRAECDKMTEKSFYENNLCHFVLENLYKWLQAQNECYLRNASIASFHNINLNSSSLNYALKGPLYWIGMTKSPWYWRYSGAYAYFSHWFFDVPSQNKSHSCVYFTSQNYDNLWFRETCQGSFALVCMKDNTGKTTSGISAGAIAGIVIWVLLLIAIISGIALFVVKKKKNTPVKHTPMFNDAIDGRNGY